MVVATHQARNRHSSDGRAPLQRREHPPISDSIKHHQRRSHTLLTSVRSVASEYREEEIVEALCQFLPPSTRELRYCVDIGACSDYDSNVKPSVSHELLTKSQEYLPPERQQRWYGILIQPDSKHYKALRQVHERDRTPTARCLQITPSWQEGLNERSLVWILRQFASQLPMDFDFLNVDGARCNNYWILNDFLECQTYHPRLLCVPHDSSFPRDVPYVPPRADKYGMASLLGLVEMTTKFRYQLVMTTKRCAFFVPNLLFQKHLRASIRQEPVRSEKDTQQETREQGTSSDPRASHHHQQSRRMTRTAEADTAAVISAGMQWLAERRKHLEQQDDQRYKTKPLNFKKQATAAWQKRKDSIIDNLKRQNARRRRQVQGEKRVSEETNQKRAQDPPDNEEKKDILGTLKKKGNDIIDLTDRESGDVREMRFAVGEKQGTKHRPEKPDPPGEDGKDLERQVQQMSSIDPEEIQDEDGKTDEAETIDSSFIETREGNEENHSKSLDSLAKTSEYLSETINRYRQTLEGSKFETQKNCELQQSGVHQLPWTLPNMYPNDKEEEEIVFDSQDDEEEIIFSTASEDSGDNDDEERLVEAMGDPVVDMNACFSDRNDKGRRRKCAHTFVAMLRQYGCAWIRGTGVSRFVCSDALMASQLLLQGADESTRRSCKAANSALRGYSPLCSEQSGETDLKDMVRKFRVGPESSQLKNVWPREGSLDANTNEYIQVSLQNYHDHLRHVGSVLMECIGEALSDEDIVVEISSTAKGPEDSLLSAWSCGRGSRHVADKPIVAPFTERNFLSILLQDAGDCAVFQHKAPDGSWETVCIPAPTPDDAVFLVYAGEFLQQTTRNLFPVIQRRMVPGNGHESTNALIFSSLSLLRPTPKFHFQTQYDSHRNETSRYWDDDDGSAAEEEWQRASLDKLASELREAEIAFGENLKLRNDDIDDVLKLAKKLMQDKNGNNNGKRQTSRNETKTARTPAANESLMIARRCRSPSEGSQGLELPMPEESKRATLPFLNLKTERLKKTNPFRLARENLLSKYTNGHENAGISNTRGNELPYRDSTSQRRSKELSRLLPPNFDCRYPLGVAAPKRQEHQLATKEMDLEMSPYSAIPKSVEKKRQTDMVRRLDHPGSPGRPILIEDDELNESSQSRFSAPRPIDSHSFSMIRQTPASNMNPFFIFSGEPGRNIFSSTSTPVTSPRESTRGTPIAANRSGGYAFENFAADHVSIPTLGLYRNLRRSDPPNATGAGVSSQQEIVRERRQHFLQLKSPVRVEKPTTNEFRRDANEESFLGQSSRLGASQDVHSGIENSERTPTVSLHDPVAQSVCSSMVETLEASDVLEELLSADDKSGRVAGGHQLFQNKEARSTWEANILSNTVDSSSEDDKIPSLEDFSTTKIKLQPSGHLTLQNSETVVSKKPSNSFLFNQTITFPQPSKHQTVNDPVDGFSANTPGTGRPSPTRKNMKTKITVNHMQTPMVNSGPNQATEESKTNVMTKEDVVNMGRYRQWKAERESLKSHKGSIQQKVKSDKTTTAVGVVGGSVSSVSELTDEGYKFGCTVPLTWLS